MLPEVSTERTGSNGGDLQMQNDPCLSQSQIADLLVRETRLTLQMAKRLVFLVADRATHHEIQSELSQCGSDIGEALYILDREGVE